MGSDAKMSKADNVTVEQVAESWMNLNTGSILYDAFETFMDFCVLYPLFSMFIYSITKNDAYIIKGLFSIAAVFLMLLTRNYIKRNILHYVLYIPIIMSVYYISENIYVKALMTIFLVIMMIISVKKRNRIHVQFRKTNYILVSEAFLLCIYLISVYLNFITIQYLTISSSIVLCAVCLIYIHISRLDTLMIWEGQKSEADKKKVNEIGIKTSAFIALLFLIFTFVLYSQNFFISKDKAFISWLFDPSIIKPKNTEQQFQQFNKPQDNLKINLPDEIMKPGPKNIFIEGILTVIECIVAVLVLMFLIVLLKALFQKLIRILSGKLYNNRERKESLLKISDIKENIKDMYKSLKKNAAFVFPTSNNYKIRRAYHKIVLRKKKKDTVIMPSYTPLIIKSVVKSDSGSDIGIATSIYEKARYGNSECTDEEVKKMKE